MGWRVREWERGGKVKKEKGLGGGMKRIVGGDGERGVERKAAKEVGESNNGVGL